MTGAICHWCGGYLDALDEHDEDACYERHRQEVYRIGGAKAKAALSEAKAGRENT